MKNYRLALFDLDGTILNSADGIIKAAEEAISTLGIPEVKKSDLMTCIGPPLVKTMVEKGFLNPENFDKFNAKFRELYENKYLLEATVYPDSFNVLTNIKKKMLTAVATNKRCDYTNKLLAHFKMKELFNGIYATDLQNKTTKAELIERCLKELNVSANDAVMIGDTESDKKAAVKAGVDFIAVNYGFGFKKGDYSPSVDSMKSILDILGATSVNMI